MTDNEKTFEQLCERLKDVRDLIGDIDGTDYGELDKLFDQMATITDKAILMAEDLQASIDWEWSA